MMNNFYTKASTKPEIGLILILILISSVAAFTGVSTSYNSSTKFDFGLTDNATSSSFTSRVISGFESIGNYSSSSFTGRFGVLEDTTTSQLSGNIVINSTDGTNRTGQNLNCFMTLNQTFNGTKNVSAKWYKNQVEYLSVDYLNDYLNGTLFNSELNSGNTTRGENWSCALRTFDGISYSDWNSSGNLTIVNSPPTITLNSPTNNSYVTNNTPSFNWTGVDDDGDSLTYDFNITLVPASLCSDAGQYVENLITNNFTSSSLNCFSDNGDSYLWSVRGDDGYSLGAWSYFNLNHAVLVDLSFPISSVSFGEISFGGSDNTTDDSPGPFVIQNNGNTFVNVNISAENLWTAVTNPTSYYRLKVDNVSGEEGAFNWTGSSVSWLNAPNSNNTLIIHRLNFTDSADSAELDIFVQVPTNETPAAKNSTITFVGSYV